MARTKPPKDMPKYPSYEDGEFRDKDIERLQDES
jgi:hypothetical protein